MPRACYEIDFYSKRIQMVCKPCSEWIFIRIAETHKIFNACLYENIYMNDGLFK